MFGQVFKVFKALNSNEKPWQLSLGLVFGAVLGLTPLLNLHNLFLLFLALIINLNFSFLILSFGLFSGIAYLLDPVFHQVGYGLLTAGGLEPFWIQFFSCPVFIISNLNNTIVMGSLVVSLLAAAPMFFIFGALLRKYRESIHSYISRFPILKPLQFLKAYESVTGS